MIKINCDIGERGSAHPVDVELMSLVHIANIACGGHAGDRESVDAFRQLAVDNGVEVAGHLSYPDPENFGRVSMEISSKALLSALDKQYSLISDVKMIKFHGALYNDVCADRRLAETLASWLSENSIRRIITPFDSELAGLSRERGIAVIAEAFAERRYAFSEATGRLSLVSRKYDYASIHDCDEAVQHALGIIREQQVEAYIEDSNGDISRRFIPIDAETICIHSDSVIALDLARRLSELS